MTDLATQQRPSRRPTVGELLTTAEVAALTGQPEGAVAGWAHSRRIRATTTADGQVLYPAALTRHIHAADTRVARAAADTLRLRRWVARALIA